MLQYVPLGAFLNLWDVPSVRLEEAEGTAATRRNIFNLFTIPLLARPSVIVSCEWDRCHLDARDVGVTRQDRSNAHVKQAVGATGTSGHQLHTV